MSDKKEATFIQRLGAFILDLIIISMIASILSMPFTKDSNYEKLSKEASEATEQYMNGELEPQTYISRSADISYDLSRRTAFTSIITIALYIVYFMIFQFKNNGQTLGKKVCKIRVISEDGMKLTINQIAIRSLIINCILVDMLILTVVIFGTKDIYFVLSMFIELIQYIIMFIAAIMVLSRKDKRGLHDLIAKTKVIREV